MKWASASVEGKDLREMVARCSAGLKASLGRRGPDLTFAFVSGHFFKAWKMFPDLLKEHFPATRILGCSVGGVIGGGLEVEQRPALSLVAACLPGVDVHAFSADTLTVPDADAAPAAWRAWTGLGEEVVPGPMIILVDPFTATSTSFLQGLDYAFPGFPKVGGMASGGTQETGTGLFLDHTFKARGLVGVMLSGDIAMDTVVSQGCRPIGPPLTVTAAEKNLLFELNGRPAMDQLKDVLESLPEADRKLARTSLFLGFEVDPSTAAPHAEHYLIRNLVGVDYHSGAIAVGAMVDEGVLVQFHLRDARASDENMRERLGRFADMWKGKRVGMMPKGALLFSCLGRGRYLYGKEGHDSGVFHRLFKGVPVGGFFCNGEIGPIGGESHLHGYTSVFGIFRPASPSTPSA